jgi:hypothetical protein
VSAGRDELASDLATRPSIPGQHASHRPRLSQANRCDAVRE